MEKFRNVTFESNKDSLKWRCGITHHQFTKATSVSAKTANQKRRLDAQINPKNIPDYRIQFKCKAAGLSKLSNHW